MEIQIKGDYLPAYNIVFTSIFMQEDPHAHAQWHGMRDQLDSNELKNTRNPTNVARTWLTRSNPKMNDNVHTPDDG